MQKRDSKSFDSGSLYRSQIDDGSNEVMGNANDCKTSLPSTPARASSLSTANNQSLDDNNTNGDRNKYGNNHGNSSSGDKGDDDEHKRTEHTNEVLYMKTVKYWKTKYIYKK